MDWDDPSPLLACRIDGSANGGITLYMIFNPSLEPAVFEMPPGAWKVRINTGSTSQFVKPRQTVHGGVQEAGDALDRPVGLVVQGKSVVVLSCEERQ
jgi:hypothetical protein